MTDKNKGDTMSDARMEIANTIQSQLGQQCLMMIGAKDLVALSCSEDYHGGLSFRIGRNAKSVTHIRIQLTGLDLYDVEFLNCRAGRKEMVKVLANQGGCYVDMLHDLIEKHTGMYVSLGRR